MINKKVVRNNNLQHQEDALSKRSSQKCKQDLDEFEIKLGGQKQFSKEAIQILLDGVL